MKESNQSTPWYFGFEEYKKVTEPQKKQKSFAWTTAIGLQAVDGLTPSDYLLQTARRNIEGEISIQEANYIIDEYYKSTKSREEEQQHRTEEADKVSVRIAEILNDGSFTFKPTTLINIHKKLFTGIYKYAGKIRDYNFTKDEWVLANDSVYYADFTEISAALDYDFDKEKDFDYSSLSPEQMIEHFVHFISNIWQIHAFCEGNTRTTAVFAIKYLRFLGFDVGNEPFAKDSWYFRNALVRANYTSNKENIKIDFSFLKLFFRNVILGEKNELKNRYMHIYWNNQHSTQRLPREYPESTQRLSELCPEEAEKTFKAIKENPQGTIKVLALNLGVSEKTVKNHIAKLKKAGLITRAGSDTKGHWIINGEN